MCIILSIQRRTARRTIPERREGMSSSTLRTGANVTNHSLGRRVWRGRYIYLLLLPGVLYMLIFKIAPLWGLLLSFKDYSAFKGFFGSPWVGFKHFARLFTGNAFPMMLRNTFAISFMNLLFFFPLPVIVALMLNEVRSSTFKRVAQSVVYLPHFLSWVVVSSLTFFLFSTNVGVINKAIVAVGGETISFLTSENSFWPMLVGQTIWKECGWGTIVFLAAMAGIDPQLYEAGVLDGASRWQQIRYITLPSIYPTIITLLILRMGRIFDTGFEQIMLMSNPMVRDVAEVFDTYAYTQGISKGQFSLGVAVGLFKGLVGTTFVVASNTVCKKAGYEGIY